MAIVLFRVDERLIHGQVVVGWSGLRPDRIVVVDPELAASPWEQELYALGLPPGIDAEFVDVETAKDALDRWRSSSERVILLTRTIAAMRCLGEGGRLRGADVNIGGIHYAPGRERALPYVFLDGRERRDLKALEEESGAHVTAQDLPGSRAVDLERLLRPPESGGDGA